MTIQIRNRIEGVTFRPGRRSRWANTPERFGLGAQLFHAVIGAAVLVMLCLGTALALWADGWQPLWQGWAVAVHKGLGAWVLLASVCWFGHWLWQKTPLRRPDQSTFLYRLARLTHHLLILLCIVMPVSGWLMVSAWGDAYVVMAPGVHLPALTRTDPSFAKAMLGLHIVLAWGLGGLLALHGAGALYHGVIKRDGLNGRMWPRTRFAPGATHRGQFRQAVKHTNKLR